MDGEPEMMCADTFPGATKIILLFSRLDRLAKHPSPENIERLEDTLRSMGMDWHIESDSEAIRIWASDNENPEIMITARNGEWEAERTDAI